MVTVQEIAEIVERLKADSAANVSGEDIKAAYGAAVEKLDALAGELKGK